MSHHRSKKRLRIHSVFFLAYVFLIVIPSFFISSYILGLLVLAFLYAITAINTDIIWGYAGILTFASAAMFGIGAYCLGIIFVHLSSAPWAVVLAFAAAIFTSILLSALMGWLVFYSRAKISDFYIAVVTLGVALSFSQIMRYGGAFTGGSNGLSGFPPPELSTQSWFLIVGGVFFVVLLLALILVRSDFGLLLRAVRDNGTRCRYLGIDVPFVKTITFCVANSVIAVAGVLFALYTSIVTPSIAGVLLTAGIVIWVIIGGRGTLFGPALVAIVLSVARPYLSTEFPLAWRAFLGIIFVAAVVAMPDGLAPMVGGFAKKLALIAKNGMNRAHDASQTGTVGSQLQEYPPATPVDDRSASSAAPDDVVLTTSKVMKRYGSFRAVDEVSLTVRKGELVSLVGPNGAGKTSYGRCISDGVERDSGRVVIGNSDLRRSPPEAAAIMGLGRKFQSPNIFESVSVGDCLRIASWKGKLPSPWRRQAVTVVPRRVMTIVRQLGLDKILNTRSGDISHGQRQALEIAMVMALEPSLLLLDEPTAGLSETERAQVGEILQDIVAQNDAGIILIEHDFEFVRRISSRVVVLVSGAVAADGTIDEVADSDLVKDVYLGRQ